MIADERLRDDYKMSYFPAAPPTSAARRIARLPLLGYRLGFGGAMNTIHLLVLTTRGKRTGNPHFSALEYRPHGSKLYVISAWGERAHWVQNVLTQPIVTVQRGTRVMSAKAEVVTQPGEALMALRLFHGTGPFIYDAVYAPMRALRGRAAVTERSLPQITNQYLILRLTPLDSPPELPALHEDLRWIAPAAGMMAVVALVLGLVVYGWRTASQRGRGRARG